MGATHERICDPWLARPGNSGKADFNSLGTSYMSEQSLDCFLQTLEMYRTGRDIYFGKNLTNKIYPDGTCYYSMDISEQEKVNLSVLPSKGTVNVMVNTWTGDHKKWTESGASEAKVTTTHTVGDLKPNTWYQIYCNSDLYGTYQSNGRGTIRFTYSGSLSSPHTFEAKQSR